MLKKLTIAAALSAALLCNVPALAQVAAAGQTSRQMAPRPLPSGISPEEAARLRHQAQHLKQIQRRAHADGEVTRREQAIINHKATQLRRLVHVAKNN